MAQSDFPVRPINVSVIEPIGPAIERVKVLLFRPFDLGRWFVIGFCAWLAHLGQGGGLRIDIPWGSRGQRFGFPRHIEDFFRNNMLIILLVGSIVLVVGVALAILLTWLSSRGRFMFLHCVAKNRAEVKVPWHKYRRQGNSLFLFRLVVGVVLFASVALLAAIIFLSIGFFHRMRLPPGGAVIAGVVAMLAIAVPVVVAVVLIVKFTHDFVVPVMYLRGCGCIEAWRQFWSVLSGNAGSFVLYILFQIVIAVVIFTIVAIVVIMTCCCAGVLLAIPYIGTVLLLPVLVFTRAYSLYYFRQFGPELDVFAAAGE